MKVMVIIMSVFTGIFLSLLGCGKNPLGSGSGTGTLAMTCASTSSGAASIIATVATPSTAPALTWIVNTGSSGNLAQCVVKDSGQNYMWYTACFPSSTTILTYGINPPQGAQTGPVALSPGQSYTVFIYIGSGTTSITSSYTGYADGVLVIQ